MANIERVISSDILVSDLKTNNNLLTLTTEQSICLSNIAINFDDNIKTLFGAERQADGSYISNFIREGVTILGVEGTNIGEAINNYTITTTLSNLTSSASNPTTITSNSSVSLVYTKESNYNWNNLTLSVSGATYSHTTNNNTLTIVLSNPTNNVSIKAYLAKQRLSIPTISVSTTGTVTLSNIDSNAVSWTLYYGTTSSTISGTIAANISTSTTTYNLQPLIGTKFTAGNIYYISATANANSASIYANSQRSTGKEWVAGFRLLISSTDSEDMGETIWINQGYQGTDTDFISELEEPYTGGEYWLQFSETGFGAANNEDETATVHTCDSSGSTIFKGMPSSSKRFYIGVATSNSLVSVSVTGATKIGSARLSTNYNYIQTVYAITCSSYGQTQVSITYNYEG